MNRHRNLSTTQDPTAGDSGISLSLIGAGIGVFRLLHSFAHSLSMSVSAVDKRPIKESSQDVRGECSRNDIYSYK